MISTCSAVTKRGKRRRSTIGLMLLIEGIGSAGATMAAPAQSGPTGSSAAGDASVTAATPGDPPSQSGTDGTSTVGKAADSKTAAETSSPQGRGLDLVARQDKADVSVNDKQPSGSRLAVYSTPGSTADADPDADPNQLLSLFVDGPGQARTSADELDLVIGRRQVFSDLRTLETRLNDMQQPTANIVDRRSTQSDHLDINQLEVSQDLFFSHGRDNLRLGVQKIDYNARSAPNAHQYVAGFTANVAVSDATSVSGELWVNRVDYQHHRYTLATYDVFVTLKPTDVIRIDLDTSRRTFDNIRSLQLGLTARSYGGSIDFVPTDQLRLTARTFGASYSDHNRRRSEEVEAVWRIENRPIIEIGARGTNFHFTRVLNNGYFNPKNYYSGEAMFRVQTEVSPGFTLEAAGSGGAEDSKPGGVRPLVKGSLQAVYKLTNGWSIEGEASHFTSRDSSSSGFARTSLTLGLHYRF